MAFGFIGDFVSTVGGALGDVGEFAVNQVGERLPRTAGGFLAGGPVGAAAGFGSSFLPDGREVGTPGIRNDTSRINAGSTLEFLENTLRLFGSRVIGSAQQALDEARGTIAPQQSRFDRFLNRNTGTIAGFGSPLLILGGIVAVVLAFVLTRN